MTHPSPERFFRHHFNAHSGPSKIVYIIGWAVIGVLIAFIFAFLFGFVVKLLWGATLTPLFGLKQPSYWQAVGLIILARLIFGGLGHPHEKHEHKNHKNVHSKKLHDRVHGFKTAGRDSAPEKEMPEENNVHYKAFWENEGKQAFEDYLRKVTEKKDHSDDPGA